MHSSVDVLVNSMNHFVNIDHVKNTFGVDRLFLMFFIRHVSQYSPNPLFIVLSATPVLNFWSSHQAPSAIIFTSHQT